MDTQNDPNPGISKNKYDSICRVTGVNIPRWCWPRNTDSVATARKTGNAKQGFSLSRIVLNKERAGRIVAKRLEMRTLKTFVGFTLVQITMQSKHRCRRTREKLFLLSPENDDIGCLLCHVHLSKAGRILLNF